MVYLFRIASIGFILEIFLTGSRLAITVMRNTITKINPICRMPNINGVKPIPIALDIIGFNTAQITPVPIEANTPEIRARRNPSHIKILNTSIPLAPRARKIPISYFR